MLCKSVLVPSGEVPVNLGFGNDCVRRIIMNLRSNDFVLYYDEIPLITTSVDNSMYEIKFESYFGYPNASHFKIVNRSKSSSYITILIDTNPVSSINDSYFEEIK